MIHPDDAGFTYSSEAEIDRAAAMEGGAFHPEYAWILSDRDVWYANPWYSGPPVPHPEDYDPDDTGSKPPPQTDGGYDPLDTDDEKPF